MAGSTRGVTTTRLPAAAASDASMAWTLSAGSGTAEVISARTTWWRSSTRCSNAWTMASISSMSSFSTTTVSRRATTFATGGSASTSRITLCFTPSGTPGLVSARCRSGWPVNAAPSAFNCTRAASTSPDFVTTSNRARAYRRAEARLAMDVLHLRGVAIDQARLVGVGDRLADAVGRQADRKIGRVFGQRLARHTDAHVDVALHLLDEAFPLRFGLGLDAALFGGDLLDAARAQGLELGRQALEPAIDLGKSGGGGGGGFAGGLEATADLLRAAGEGLGERRSQEVDEAADEDGEIEQAGEGGADGFGVGGLRSG